MSDSIRWGSYSIRPRRATGLLVEREGAIVLGAEHEYVVELPPGAPETVWQAVDEVGDGFWLLRFGNFVGESELGGRRLLVTSNRLSSKEVDVMLDRVVEALHSLPFAFDTPTGLPYARDLL